MKAEIGTETLGKKNSNIDIQKHNYKNLEKRLSYLHKEYNRFYEDIRLTFLDMKVKEDQEKEQQKKKVLLFKNF